MSDTAEVLIEAPKATLSIERSVQVRPYEQVKIGMFFPVNLPTGGPPFGDSDEEKAYYEAVDKAVQDGFTTIKSHVFQQLGLEFEVKNGIIVESLIQTFPGSVEAPPAANPNGQAQQAYKPPSAASPGVPESCPQCGGVGLYDNRADKASGKSKPTYPDFKCKDKACAKGIWLTKR